MNAHLNNHPRRNVVSSEWGQRLPLRIDSVGFMPQQERINRQSGFFCFHWLHTVEGAGDFTVNDKTFRLSPRQGVLLRPNVPHSYRGFQNPWKTWFLTFDGALAHSIVSTLDIPLAVPLTWDSDSPMNRIHEQFDPQVNPDFDFAGVNGSLEVYSFLIEIKKYTKVAGHPSFSDWHRKLMPLLVRLEDEYGDPTIDLAWMSDILHISPQRMNHLFRGVFGVSPYRYLLQLRIAKSKELLCSAPDLSIKHIAEKVGFYDTSHFVATFRKFDGKPPEQFRRQYFS